MEVLLRAGANADVTCELGETPLTLTVQAGMLDACNALLLVVGESSGSHSAFLMPCSLRVFKADTIREKVIDRKFPLGPFQYAYLKVSKEGCARVLKNAASVLS